MPSAERSRNDDLSTLLLLNRKDVTVLTPDEERRLLSELDEYRMQIIAGSAIFRPADASPLDPADVHDFVRTLPKAAPATDEEAALSSVARRYNSTRTRLAMANLRLVAHVARRYRDRGLSSSDLLQEGFCGLLTAIDRYDASNGTRLASYAVWWIRQALQRAVAAGVYPVRLNPRHLQRLAEVSHEADGLKAGKPARPRSASVEATLKQIHAATRPAVSLDAPLGDASGSSLLDTLSTPAVDEADDLDRDEQLASLIGQLKPREQTVLELRFGLNGQPTHSLSQVSEVLDVSKERIRQIQDAALSKLRTLAHRRACCEAV